ncbi:MAG: undecaprenyl-diphosphatase UppP [Anaerolineaceae bacterium]|nr:undecaprenyl-diphosphatase UppP [Anaerolineaceae bacterium]
MTTLLQAIILGIIQGLTEFIPVSSSAHLIIVPWLFRWNDPALTSLPFDVALHLGTLVSVLWYFRADWGRLIRAGIDSIRERNISNDPNRRLSWLVIIACIPGGIAGVLLEGKIGDWFHTPNQPINSSAMIVMAVIIIVLGLLLFLAERFARHTRNVQQMTLKDALLIGVSQAFAVFPGVSRSGSTITAGLAIGFERESAARFSFLLSAPIIAGAGLKSLAEIYAGISSGSITQNDLTLFPIGVIAATISGYMAIRFLMRYLQSNSTNIFVYYRWILTLVILVVALTRG